MLEMDNLITLYMKASMIGSNLIATSSINRICSIYNQQFKRLSDS